MLGKLIWFFLIIAIAVVGGMVFGQFFQPMFPNAPAVLGTLAGVFALGYCALKVFTDTV